MKHISIISVSFLLTIFVIVSVLLNTNSYNFPKADAVFPEPKMAEVKLGRLLFYDPILSGNKNIACASCHHPRFGTSDGLSLGLGDGAIGLGNERRFGTENMPELRIPRNSPALFNLGASEFQSLFHDGRLEADPSSQSGIRTPLSEDMEEGFASVLAAQSMFPVLSGDEMAGHYSENEIARRVRQGVLTGDGGAWDAISKRVGAIPLYREEFNKLIGNKPIHFTDIANMIAAFIAFEFRADNSVFDQYLRGENKLDLLAIQGMNLFYGKAGCGNCHSGQFQTDQKFHAIAMPQIGPGKADRFETHNRDIGRMRVTGNEEDAYAFRTPSLRNIFNTAPYGHSGAYSSLEAVIRHHLNPKLALLNYDRSQVILPYFPNSPDFAIMDNDKELLLIASANELEPIELSDDEISLLINFMATLTDPVSLEGRLGVPEQVPSGLRVDQ